MHQQPAVQFTNEESRQDYYKSSKYPSRVKLLLTNLLLVIENEKTPAYSTLNLDVLPQPSFVSSLDSYQAKIDPELIKEILKSQGVLTSDERVYKMMSAMLEIRLLDIIKEVRIVSGQSNISQPPTGTRGNDPDVLQPK